VSTSADAFALGFDLRAERRQRLRRSLRIAVPIVTLLILFASIAGIGAYLHQANREDARLLADDLLEELERRIVAEVVAFLEPAVDAIRLAEQAFADRPLEEQRERLAIPRTGHILLSSPQLATFSFADLQGNFVMIKRSPDGSTDLKLIDRRGDEVDSRWIRRDTSGKVLGIEPDPTDTYDPRSRPWYLGAAATKELYWSDVYVFFTDQRPGITASLPIYDENGELTAVYAIDIGLDQLSAFLGGLEIGRSGRAMIIDHGGVFVAYPVLQQMVKAQERGLERVHVEELADPVLNRAFDRLRVDGPGKRELYVEGRRFINTAYSLKPVLGRDWTLLIVVPEDDFVGFVAENELNGLYMSVAVLCLASLLAGLLVVHGLRADRNGLLVLERQKQLEAQSSAFSDLAAQAAIFDSEDESAVSALTETVARTVNTRRISVWRLTGDGQGLVCEDAFDKETGGHTGGMELTSTELPQFFDSLARGEEIVAVDAAAEPRTAELHRVYLHPLGCRGLASVPIVRGEEVVGAVWLEYDAERIGDESREVAFARAVANMLALRMRAGGEVAKARNGTPRRVTGEQRDIGAHMRDTELVTGRRAEALLARISREQSEGARIGAEVFEDVTVVVVGDDSRNAVDNLVHRLETLAAECGVEYVKLLGDQIVCAAGFSEESQRGAEAMADFALGALDHIARLFARLERSLEYKMGIDSGPVIGSAVGRDRSIFNLWGEAVLTATRMAETGVSGQIHATESTYRRLREDFLFRVRGSYYLEGFGEFTTYVLTGRL
jgi:class 3 adenylate cyclase